MTQKRTPLNVVVSVMVRQQPAPGPARRSAVLVIAVLGFIAAIASGCDVFFPPPPPKPVSNWSRQEAREFHEFPLYWLSQATQGLDLTLMSTHRDGDGVRHAEFSYGQLSYYGGADSGSWHSPLEIDIQPYCGYFPEEVQSQPRYLSPRNCDHPGSEEWMLTSSATITIGTTCTLWSGNSAIHISAHKTGFDTEQAARDLMPIGSKRQVQRLSRFPPPTSTEC